MKLSNNEVQAFALAEFNTFNLNDFNLDKDLALRELEANIALEWDELNSEDVMQSRHHFFNIANTQSSDYSEKLLDLGADRKIIYGIRHLGGDRQIPFVQLKANFQIESQSEALEIFSVLKDEVLIFKPLYLCFWSNQKLETDFIGSTYLVTTAKKMKALPQWKNEVSLEFVPVSDDSYYNWYKAGYEKFHAERPELEKRVTLNSLDSMKDSQEQGLLFEVYLDKEKIGLTSGERSSLLGHRGIYFHEIFIDQKWKGVGLAKAIQRKFVTLTASDDEFIWGTIDNSNFPSYKTALSNGRVPIRFECFIKLNDRS